MSKNRFSLCLCDFFAVCCHIVLFKFMIKFSLFDDVLRKKTDAMDFMGSFFHYFTKIPTLGKRGSHNLHWLQATDFKIRINTLIQCVLWGPLSIISHKSHPWKTGDHTIWRNYKQQILKIRTNTHMQWVLWGLFSIIWPTTPPPGKRWSTRDEGTITTKAPPSSNSK